MTKTKFSFAKLMALSVASAITVVCGVSISGTRASSPMPPNTLPDINITSEQNTLDSFADDLAKFDKKRAQLGKKPSITSAEFNLLKNDHDVLKQRLSQVPNAIRSIITKLKAAGRWEKFDEELLASSTDDKFKASVREFGGARRLFEDAASQLGSSAAADEVLGTLGDVQKKVAGNGSFERPSPAAQFRMVAASYQPAEPMVKRTAGCIFATIRYAGNLVAHPFTPGAQQKGAANYSCKCHDVCDETE